MHHFVKYATIATFFLLATTTDVDAFVGINPGKASLNPNTVQQQPAAALFDIQKSFNSRTSTTSSSSSSITRTSEDKKATKLFSSNNKSDIDAMGDEVQKLKSMAAKLRAEAAALEADKAQEIADATERAFRKFDINDDGEVSTDELKAGLEKFLNAELPETLVQKLMTEFDTSGDGALQRDEFVSVERFRNRLEGIIRDEKEAASEAKKQAKVEQEKAVLAEARANMLNDGSPSTSDKVLSTLPYLFPLMDGLAFGRFLLADADNPAVQLLALIYTFYRSIPFSGFITIIAFSTLSGNYRINRIIRFNMQQAIYLDVALFVPAFIASIYSFIIKGIGGVQLPEITTQISSDVIFVMLIAAIGYTVGSSLLGATPDKIPVISNYVDQRMPTVDMLDDNGQFVPPQVREQMEKEKEKADKKDNDKNDDEEKK